MITVGLDFGTHQSKICIENKEQNELSYNFFQFTDMRGKKQYTLLSVIRINNVDSKLQYGYLTNKKGKIIRYFKQAVFGTQSVSGMSQDEAKLYSIWYLAFILFDLEELYGTDFHIQMGVPADYENLQRRKEIAVEILAAAYHLVENIYDDKKKFLNATYEELISNTKLFTYSEGLKEEYQILVFPEAYICLMPLVKSSKIGYGMSLMVDIGGGTTDISFFKIREKEQPPVPHIYEFYSIDKGLNYLTEAENREKKGLNSNVKSEREINSIRREAFQENINQYCKQLKGRLLKIILEKRSFFKSGLLSALRNRPIIYTGGGSTFSSLRTNYEGFEDKIHISEKEWRTEAVKDLDYITKKGLCPILSTAYGLSISVPHDNITCHPFIDIFDSQFEQDTAINNERFKYEDYNSVK